MEEDEIDIINNSLGDIIYLEKVDLKDPKLKNSVRARAKRCNVGFATFNNKIKSLYPNVRIWIQSKEYSGLSEFFLEINK